MENGAIKRMTICGSRPIFRRLILDGSKSGGKYFWVVSGQQGVRDEGLGRAEERIVVTHIEDLPFGHLGWSELGRANEVDEECGMSSEIVDMRGRLERANGEERYQSGCSAASGINPLILRKILALTTVASKRRRPKSDCLNVPCIAIG
jgi:hypothetical protein